MDISSHATKRSCPLGLYEKKATREDRNRIFAQLQSEFASSISTDPEPTAGFIAGDFYVAYNVAKQTNLPVELWHFDLAPWMLDAISSTQIRVRNARHELKAKPAAISETPEHLKLYAMANSELSTFVDSGREYPKSGSRLALWAAEHRRDVPLLSVPSRFKSLDHPELEDIRNKYVAKHGSDPVRRTAERDDTTWRAMLIEAAHATPPYPGGSGDGIVIPGGGIYFDAAYCSIRVIRMLGCALPIELWHMGPMEMLPWQRAAIEPLNVTIRDAFNIPGEKPSGGWQLKPFAVCNSDYERVLFLDADCYPAYDPTRWLSSFEVHPSIFWADQPQFETPDAAFDIIGVQKGTSRPFESGQFLVDRKASWKELSLAWWMNRNSDYYYDLVHGDKELFRIAWLFYGTPITMPPREYATELPAIIGFDFDNQPAFIHRCCGKLSLASGNVFSTNSSPSFRNDRLPHEAEVWKFLEELRAMRPAFVGQLRRSCCGGKS